MRPYAAPAIALLAWAAAAGASAREAPESWGKPGVTFDAYRADAFACGKAGFFRDVSQDDAAKSFIRGFRSADDELNKMKFEGIDLQHWRDSVARTQPDRKMREVHGNQVGAVERCLVARGYARFALTKDEVRRLKRLRSGSEARRRYLHRLAAAPR